MAGEIKEFTFRLENAFKKGLPGTDVQWVMASPDRMRDNFPKIAGPDAREAGVLIMLYPYHGSVHTIFMQRPDYSGFHGGQISFPGGKKESSDENIIRTALREAQEETGLEISLVKTAGTLTPLFIPVSNMLVTAVAACIDSKPHFRPDPREVLFLIEADLNQLLNPAIVKTKSLEIRGEAYNIKYFDYMDHVIWGATAMMLNELLELIRRNNISPKLQEFS
jgi:8-oxo-dGTP pyrophosphatase MutT (NUDIX family)